MVVSCEELTVSIECQIWVTYFRAIALPDPAIGAKRLPKYGGHCHFLMLERPAEFNSVLQEMLSKFDSIEK